jgi:hypothetical protein
MAFDLSDVSITETPNVAAITTTATAATALGTVAGLYLFESDGDIWFRVGNSAVTAPVIADASSTGRCHVMHRGQEKLVYLRLEQLYIRVITDANTSSTYFRWEFVKAI